MTSSRREDLKAILERRRHDIHTDVQNKMRAARTNGATHQERSGGMDDLDVRSDEDIDFALIQINAEILDRINDALARLERGEYGRCCDCDEDIPENRLRAMPFATRCRGCQEHFEGSSRRQRQFRSRDTGLSSEAFDR
jgi:RNA polymerase-binding transcription factor DksA